MNMSIDNYVNALYDDETWFHSIIDLSGPVGDSQTHPTLEIA